jgi:hypothetical protein
MRTTYSRNVDKRPEFANWLLERIRANSCSTAPALGEICELPVLAIDANSSLVVDPILCFFRADSGIASGGATISRAVCGNLRVGRQPAERMQAENRLF